MSHTVWKRLDVEARRSRDCSFFKWRDLSPWNDTTVAQLGRISFLILELQVFVFVAAWIIIVVQLQLAHDVPHRSDLASCMKRSLFTPAFVEITFRSSACSRCAGAPPHDVRESERVCVCVCETAAETMRV